MNMKSHMLMYTSDEMLNKKPMEIRIWPNSRKKSGDLSRVKSTQTAKVKAMLKRIGLK